MVSGIEYEHLCANYLNKLGYSRIEVTRASGDQGVDIIAFKDGYKYAIQCKYYSSPVGNSAIQEVVAGAAYYGCDKKIVITNNTFTQSAVELAKSNMVELMPDITENVVTSSASTEIISISHTYERYQHFLPNDGNFLGFFSYEHLENIYKLNTLEIEKYYRFLRNKKIEKYKPTNSYHSTSTNFLYGINDELNKSLEDFAKKMLLNLQSDELSAESTRLRTEKDSFIMFFRSTSGLPLDDIKLKYIQAHLNYLGEGCSFLLNKIDDKNFTITVSKRKVIDVGQECQNYNLLKAQYTKNKLINQPISVYSDGFFSKKYFDDLEEGVFNNVGYYLMHIQNILPVDYIMQPLKLLSVEYCQTDCQLMFFYYCKIDLRFFKDFRYRKFRKSIQIPENSNCVFLISVKVSLNDYFIIQRSLTVSKPISYDNFIIEFCDASQLYTSHNPPLMDGLAHIHPNYIVAASDFDTI